MVIPDLPEIVWLRNVTPPGDSQRDVFWIHPPIILDDATEVHHVVTSFGFETILGDDTFAVFLSDELGLPIDWVELYSGGTGPGWCVDLLSPEKFQLPRHPLGEKE